MFRSVIPSFLDFEAVHGSRQELFQKINGILLMQNAVGKCEKGFANKKTVERG